MRLCPTCKGNGVERIENISQLSPYFNINGWSRVTDRRGLVAAYVRVCETCKGQEIIPDPTCGVPLIPRREVRS